MKISNGFTRKAFYDAASQEELDDLASRLDSEPYDNTKVYGEGEIFYYAPSSKSYRVLDGTHVAGETPDSHPAKFAEAGATADMTDSEILAAVESESGVDLSSLPVLTVADNAAKLALTDVAVGQVVIIAGEGNRTERYLGDISGDDSGLHIDTAHTDVGGNTFGGYYYKYASNEWRKQGANPYAQRLYINGPNWALSADVSDNFTIAKTGSNPWDEVGTWTGPGGKTIPASAVTKAPVATEANWATVQHAPAEGAFADGDKDKLDDAVTKSDAQTVTGQKTHTADIRISHNPDHDDAVLPRRMADDRYHQTMIAMRTGNLDRSETTTLADDTQLTLPVEANTRYLAEVFIQPYGIGGTSQGINVGISAPAGYDMEMRFFASNDGSFTAGSCGRRFSDWGGNPRSIPSVSSSGECSVEIKGMIETSGTAGNVTVKWAQATSNTNATRVAEGSYIRLTKIN